MVKKPEKTKIDNLERISLKITNWIGTPISIVIHTFLFLGIFTLRFFGLTIDSILLILTTVVSLEAIYLAIFIQMTVNRNTKSLEEVEADIDEIQEDVEELEDDVEDITEDIDEIQTRKTINNIEVQLEKLVKELEQLKK